MFQMMFRNKFVWSFTRSTVLLSPSICEMAARRSSHLAVRSMAEELFTVQDIFRASVTLFNKEKLSFGQSTVDAVDDATFLILRALNLPISSLDMWLPCRLTLSERVMLLELILSRVQERKPVAYLVKGVYQQGEYFFVNENTLIPRSFIGDILNRVKEEFCSSHDDDRWHPFLQAESVLDLCTGSGCLGILAAKFLPEVTRVDLVDISADALEVAKGNIEFHKLGNIMETFCGDLYEALASNHSSSIEKKYDLIICNPPYVDSEGIRNLPPEYIHEPILALDGGTDGLRVIHGVLRGATKYLNSNGGLILEIGRCRQQLEYHYPNLKDQILWFDTPGMESYGEVMYISKKSMISAGL